MNLSDQLYEDGVVVITSAFLLQNLPKYRNEFFKQFPEFKIHPGLNDLVKDTTDRVLRYGIGGTSFIGNPSITLFFEKCAK